MSTTTANRADWLGRTIDGRFRLLETLGGSNHARVFRTEIADPTPQNAAIKLISVAEAGSVDLLAQWQVAQSLQHPHLARILACGRCRVDISHYFYVVTEFADELLSQIIPDRPLTTEETHDMLAPVLDTLAYLHGNGFVHGHLIPSNILVIGEQLKISADDIVAAGAPRTPRPVELHDAPEVETTPASQAQDIWSLGATLVESLTQHAPAWDRSSDTAPEVPSSLPAPYKAIALRCLQLDPTRRPTVENLQALLEGRAVPSPEPQRAAAPAPQPQHTPPQPPPPPPTSAPAGPITTPKEAHSYLHRAEMPSDVLPQSRPNKQPDTHLDAPKLESYRLPVLPLIIGFVVIIAIVIALAMRHRPTPTSQTPAPSTATSTPENPPATSATAPADQTPPAPSQPAPAPATSAQTTPPATQPASQPPSSTPAPAPPPPIHVAQGPAEQGAVLERVLPDVPAKAMRTITGTVKISVRVTVDNAGSVSNATLDSAGPSPYFANFALNASRKWKFRPAQSSGQPAASTWLLHYRLRHSGIEVTPEEQKP